MKAASLIKTDSSRDAAGNDSGDEDKAGNDEHLPGQPLWSEEEKIRRTCSQSYKHRTQDSNQQCAGNMPDAPDTPESWDTGGNAT
jgi:hypothetical protein